MNKIMKQPKHNPAANSNSQNGQNSSESTLNSFHKLPPQSLEIEAAVLGIILGGGKNEKFEEACDIFQGINMLYKEDHRIIWDVMQELDKSGRTIDVLVVNDLLKTKGLSEKIGGNYFLMKLVTDVVESASFVAYCRKIQEHYIERELIMLASTIIASIYSGEGVFNVIQSIEDFLYKIQAGILSSDYKPVSDDALEVIERIERLSANPGSVTGVPTGYSHLDNIVYGWQKPDFIIIAARPSVGKTSFTTNLAINAAMKGTPVGIFSLEMSSNQISERILSALSLIPLEFIRRGDVTKDQKDVIYSTYKDISKLPVFIDDTSAITVSQLKTKARRMVLKNKVGLIIIDYLQLMRGIEEKTVKTREQEVSKISRDLKALAKQLEIPIIALSQLSRAIESRNGGEPQLSDLRDSGGIEQDADLVGFLTRMDYQKTEDKSDPALANKATLWIKKHRNGKLDDIPFETDLSTQRWLEPRTNFDNTNSPAIKNFYEKDDDPF